MWEANLRVSSEGVKKGALRIRTGFGVCYTMIYNSEPKNRCWSLFGSLYGLRFRVHSQTSRLGLNPKP